MNSPILRDELTVLAAFAVVADERSFTKAAAKLGVSRSAISHSIRTLEERLGLRLLARTTRAVAPTDAGERLLAQLGPALHDIEAALTDVGRLRERPAGVIRLIAPPIVLATLLGPKLATFTREYPDVVLDLMSEDDVRRDLVAGHFDAGIHLGEFLQRDMVAVRVTGATACRGRRRTGVLRVTSEAEDTARPDGSPLPPVPHGDRRPRLSVGVREARQTGDGVRDRALSSSATPSS